MKDTKKISKTRRQRGYQWEDSIVKQFNSLDDWNSVRLGSPSNSLPDVMAINNNFYTILAIEAKSTVGNLVYVPQDQIERCLEWVDRFSIYHTRKVILAFKFGQIKGKRKLTTFYKIFPHQNLAPCEVKGDQYGNTWIRTDRWHEIEMEDLNIV